MMPCGWPPRYSRQLATVVWWKISAASVIEHHKLPPGRHASAGRGPGDRVYLELTPAATW